MKLFLIVRSSCLNTLFYCLAHSGIEIDFAMLVTKNTHFATILQEMYFCIFVIRRKKSHLSDADQKHFRQENMAKQFGFLQARTLSIQIHFIPQCWCSACGGGKIYQFQTIGIPGRQKGEFPHKWRLLASSFV